MEHKDKLIDFVLNNENRKAESLLTKIREASECDTYADAREKILLIETAKSLNDNLPNFYADVKKLTVDLFESNVSVKDAIDFLCAKVKDSLKAERQTAYLKALAYTRENLCSNQLSVSSAAEYAGISQTGLIKLFAENMGITPGDYIGKGRCEKSLELLKENASVESTALSVGFSSVESYIRAFRKHMGMTPGMWKKKYL